MDGNILFDTSVVISAARTRDRYYEVSEVIFKGLTPHLSAISITELWSGLSMDNSKEEYFVSTFLKGLNIIFPDRQILELAGVLRRSGDCQGGTIDSIIAATAIKNNLILLTYDPKHFRNIPNLKILEPKYFQQELTL